MSIRYFCRIHKNTFTYRYSLELLYIIQTRTHLGIANWQGPAAYIDCRTLYEWSQRHRRRPSRTVANRSFETPFCCFGIFCADSRGQSVYWVADNLRYNGQREICSGGERPWPDIDCVKERAVIGSIIRHRSGPTTKWHSVTVSLFSPRKRH